MRANTMAAPQAIPPQNSAGGEVEGSTDVSPDDKEEPGVGGAVDVTVEVG